MIFAFDIDKAIAATAYLISEAPEELDMFLALKMLYLADRRALLEWGKPITGDSFVSMDRGPVPRTIYNLFKGLASKEDQTLWNKFISEMTTNNKVRLLQSRSLDDLSLREMSFLKAAMIKVKQIPPDQLADWLHQNCPEWTDPHGSSIPIDPGQILRKEGKSEEEISRIEESNEHFKMSKVFLEGHF